MGGPSGWIISIAIGTAVIKSETVLEGTSEVIDFKPSFSKKSKALI